MSEGPEVLTCGAAPRRVLLILHWEPPDSDERPTVEPLGGNVSMNTQEEVKQDAPAACVHTCGVRAYLQRVELPESCVLGIAVFWFIELWQIESTALNLIIQQEVTFGEGLARTHVKYNVIASKPELQQSH